MSFFKRLSELDSKVTLTLRVMAKNENLTVSIVPDTVNKIQPLVVTGTPEWLDENFVTEITKPIAELNAVLNAKEFSEDVKNLSAKPGNKNKVKAEQQSNESDSEEEDEDTETKTKTASKPKPASKPEKQGPKPESLF